MFKAPSRKRKKPHIPKRERERDLLRDEDDVYKGAKDQHDDAAADDSNGKANLKVKGMPQQEAASKKKKKKRKKLKAKHTGTLSFNLEDEGDEDDNVKDEDKGDSERRTKKSVTKKNNRKGTGFGFGGGMSSMDMDLDLDADNEETETDNKMSTSSGNDGGDPADATAAMDKGSGSGGGLYSKHNLNKLKSQQKIRVGPSPVSASASAPENTSPMMAPKAEHETAGKSSFPLPPAPSSSLPILPPINASLPPKPNQNSLPKKPAGSAPEEDYISFDGPSRPSTDPFIVSGDDVLQFTGESSADIKFGDQDDEVEMGTSGNCYQPNVNIDMAGNITQIPSNSMRASCKNSRKGEISNEDNHINDTNNDVNEEERKWEEEVARRAGVRAGAGQSKRTGSGSDAALPHAAQVIVEHETETHQGQSTSTTSSQAEEQRIKQTIRTTLNTLTQQDLDIESAMVRKRHEAQSSQEEALQKEQDLERTGTSFEYYQRLRVDLADWMGGLRFLEEKVGLIERAMVGLYRDIGEKRLTRWREWEDDVMEVLGGGPGTSGNGSGNVGGRDWLDYMVGRQSQSAQNASHHGNGSGQRGHMQMQPEMDEFGRDIRSMESLARSKKRMERERRQAESQDRRRSNNATVSDTGIDANYPEDTDADISDNELMDRQERRDAFSDALQVALEGTMSDEFTSLQPLLSFFQSWHDAHPDDYRKCYVNLALADLISVLARAEFCKKLDLLCLSSSSSSSSTNAYTLDEFQWYLALENSFLSKNEKYEANSKRPIEIITKRVCLEALRSCMSYKQESGSSIWPYDPFSKRQSKRLSLFCGSMLSKLSDKEETVSELQPIIYDYINSYLQEMCFPVLKGQVDISGADSETLKMYQFATIGQLYRLERLLMNILEYWYPVLENSLLLAKFCFVDIITYRFLPTFQSIQANSKEARDVFVKIWKEFNRLGWTNNDDLMLSSSPFRATAATIIDHE